MAAPALKPEFGPALPALLRARFGIRPPVTVAAVLVAVALLGFAMVAVRPGSDPGDQLLHRSAPEFNLLYDGDRIAPVDSWPGELARLEGEGGRQQVTVTVRPLDLPPFRGDVAHALLPAFAAGHIDRLQAAFPGFDLQEEGRARVNDAPGYEVVFEAGMPGRRLYGSDVLLVPVEDDPRGAVVLSLRREVSGRGRLGERGRELTRAAKRAFRTFRYGLDRG